MNELEQQETKKLNRLVCLDLGVFYVTFLCLLYYQGDAGFFASALLAIPVTILFILIGYFLGLTQLFVFALGLAYELVGFFFRKSQKLFKS